jgi:hypothetical protein
MTELLGTVMGIRRRTGKLGKDHGLPFEKNGSEFKWAESRESLSRVVGFASHQTVGIMVMQCWILPFGPGLREAFCLD